MTNFVNRSMVFDAAELEAHARELRESELDFLERIQQSCPDDYPNLERDLAFVRDVTAFHAGALFGQERERRKTDRVTDAKRQVEMNLRTAKTELRAAKKDLSTATKSLAKATKSLDKEVKAHERDVKRLDGKIEKLQGSLDRVKRSRSYRAGRALTYLPRKLRKLAGK
jgi:septal ring factor EnvC (AmiA/AmiB activator)